MIEVRPIAAAGRGGVAAALARLPRLLRDRAAARRSTPRTFARLIDPEVRDYHGLLAVAGGRAGRARPLHLPPPRLADRGRLLPAGPLRRAGGARRPGAGRALIEAVYAAADAAGRPNVYWLTAGVQRHRAAALRPGRPGDAVHQVPPLRPCAAALLACLAARRPCRLRRRPAAGRDHLGALRRRRPCRAGVARSNRDLAQDFLDLTFGLESGEKLDHLLRYEAPVRVYLRLARARRLPARPRGADRAAAHRGRHRHRRDRRPERGADPHRGGAGRADRPGLPDRRLLHRAGRDRLAGASCAAAPTRGCAGRTRRRSSARRSSCRSTPRRRTCATA